jgi:hypothetical protein
MSIKALFESLDDKVFTAELKESLEQQFNEAVELKAAVIADDRIEEEVEKLNEKSEKHIEFLNEKSEEYIKLKESEMLDQVDKYLERVVDEFVSEAKESLEESVKSDKADMIIEAFDAMLVATGVKVAQIVEAKDESDVENKLEESTGKYDRLVEENISLMEENERLIKMGVIAEMCEDLSLVEAEKFKRLADIVEFTKDSGFVKKLEQIKESIKGTPVSDKLEESVESDKGETAKPAWAHLV